MMADTGAGIAADLLPYVFDRFRQADLNGVRILIVDDEAETRATITDMLSRYGARVLAVASVDEALTAMRLRRPDVLVSDIGMPGEDG